MPKASGKQAAEFVKLVQLGSTRALWEMQTAWIVQLAPFQLQEVQFAQSVQQDVSLPLALEAVKPVQLVGTHQA